MSRVDWDKLKRQERTHNPILKYRKPKVNLGFHELSEYEKKLLSGKWKPRNIRKQQQRERTLRVEPQVVAHKASIPQRDMLVNTMIPTGAIAAKEVLGSTTR